MLSRTPFITRIEELKKVNNPRASADNPGQLCELRSAPQPCGNINLAVPTRRHLSLDHHSTGRGRPRNPKRQVARPA
jgi:hypothetical protein